VLIVLLAKGSASLGWTGFRGKSLWDLLQLLIIPLALAGIGFWFAAQQDARQQKIENQRAEAERDLADQRAQDETLQAYLDQMNSLLLEKDLRASEEDSEVRTLAPARTLTVLGRLEDPSRKTAVMQFLIEADLVQSVEGRGPVIRLGGVNLSDANLNDANLSGAVLSDADLSESDLSDADLSYAILSDAELFSANLSEANLSFAVLTHVTDVTSVGNVTWSGADLSGAKVSRADLRDLRSTEDLEKQPWSPEARPPKPGDIFSDDFSGTNSKWPRGEFQKNTDSYYVLEYFDGLYRMYSPPPRSGVDIWNYQVGTQEDIIVEVDAQVSGDAPHGTGDLGIVCRVQAPGNYYLLTIRPPGDSAIHKQVDNKWRQLAIGGNSDAIRGGTEKYHLRADCLGDKLALWVNGHKVVEAEDSTFDSGGAGLHMLDFGDHKFEVLYDNFLVSSP
jgi:hypothetical protein